ASSASSPSIPRSSIKWTCCAHPKFVVPSSTTCGVCEAKPHACATWKLKNNNRRALNSKLVCWYGELLVASCLCGAGASPAFFTGQSKFPLARASRLGEHDLIVLQCPPRPNSRAKKSFRHRQPSCVC